MTDRAKLIADIAALQSDASEIAEAIEFKKQKLAEELGMGETPVKVGDGWVNVIVYQHKTFNEGYGKNRRPDLWDKAKVVQEVVTSASAKQNLSPEEYAEFQKPSDKLSVKLEVVAE